MAQLAGRKVLVTGAHGFVAGHLIERLAEAGAEVIGVDLWMIRQSYLSMSPAIRRTDLIEGDISNLEEMQALFDEHRPQIVVHLAAQADVTRALSNPLGTFEANVRGTYIVLECARRIWQDDGDPHALVIAGSDKAYGHHDYLPYREDDALLGLFPYDASKACADIIARGYHAAWGLPTGVVRCAQIYGPGDLNFNRIVPGTLRALLRGERPTIRSDGTPVRDYIYVADAVDGYMRVMGALLAGRHMGEAFNIGSGEGVSVLSIFREMAEIAGRPDLQPQVLGEATRELQDQVVSAERARRLLGWEVQVPRAEGLRRTFTWYRDNLAHIEV